MPTNFDAYRKQRGRPSGVCDCGKPTAGRVQVSLLEKQGDKSIHVASKGRGYCESCAIKLYEKIVEEL